jgi:purine nucleosidase
VGGSRQAMRRLHLDTDIGGDPDDVCALALSLRLPDVELTGVTTVNEQNGRRAGYVHEVMRLVGWSGTVPVAAGAVEGIDPPPLEPVIPDGPEFWPNQVLPCPGPPDAALELLGDSLRKGATVVGIGPYTNLARYEQKHPGELAENGLVVMGGYLGPLGRGLPAWGPKEDWNMLVDPAATEIIFEQCHPLFVPIDVTIQVHLRLVDLPRLRAAGPLGDLLARQAVAHDAVYSNHTLSRRYAALPADLLNFHHDPLAVAVAAGWTGVRVEDLQLRLDVQDGRPTLVNDDAGRTVRVVTDVDADRFRKYWLDAICSAAK